MLRAAQTNSPKCMLMIVLVIFFLSLTACTRNLSTTGSALFAIEVADERLRVLLTEPESIQQARTLLNSGANKVLTGDLASGDGGFNHGYSWHLVPESIGFHDATIELCDARPSFVEEHLDYWLATVKTYCPWNSRVVWEEVVDEASYSRVGY